MAHSLSLSTRAKGGVRMYRDRWGNEKEGDRSHICEEGKGVGLRVASNSDRKPLKKISWTAYNERRDKRRLLG